MSERTAPKGYKLYKYKSISQFKKKKFNLENSVYYCIPGATYSCRNYYEKQIVPCESTSEEVSWSKSQNHVTRLHIESWS